VLPSIEQHKYLSLSGIFRGMPIEDVPCPGRCTETLMQRSQNLYIQDMLPRLKRLLFGLTGLRKQHPSPPGSGLAQSAERRR
jgi:hypothetical protein